MFWLFMAFVHKVASLDVHHVLMATAESLLYSVQEKLSNPVERTERHLRLLSIL